MPEFAYTARNDTGEKVSGMLTASNQRDALMSLSAQSLFPIEVKAKAEAAQQLFNRRIKPQLLATVYGQLAGLIRSGVPLLRSLTVIKEQTTHSGLKEVLSNIHDSVEDGATLAEAMQRHPKVFGEMAINMVSAGGEGGFLEDVLEQVSDFTEKQQDLKGRTIGALIYPLVLAVVGVLVVTVLIVFVVPKFEGIFASLREKGQLPWATDMLLALSAVLGSWWGVIGFCGLLAGVFALRKYFETDQGRLFRDTWLLKIPIVGGILLNLAVSRFCRILGTLLKNGVPILKSLSISTGSAGNMLLKQAIEDAAENVTAGESLAKPLAASGNFPPAVVEMIAIAEESNSLDIVLVNISESLDKQTWRKMDLFVRMLEPLMLLLMATIVLFIVIALLVPVMKMSTVVQ